MTATDETIAAAAEAAATEPDTTTEPKKRTKKARTPAEAQPTGGEPTPEELREIGTAVKEAVKEARSSVKAKYLPDRVYWFKPSQLRQEPGLNDTIRDKADPEEKKEAKLLKDSIDQFGYQTPLTFRVLPEGETIVHGHRRHDAGLALEADGRDVLIPAVLEAKGKSDEQRRRDLATNNIHKGMSVLKKAEHAALLKQDGLADKQIAAALGVVQSYVGALLRLNAAPAELRKMIQKGAVSPTLAIDQIREHGPEGALEVLKQAAEVAAESGEDKVTKTKVAKEKAPKETPQKQIHYLTDNVTRYLDFIAQLATAKPAELKDQPLKFKRAASELLKSVDIDAADWLADMEEVTEEE